jgi:hypothetical protein
MEVRSGAVISEGLIDKRVLSAVAPDERAPPLMRQLMRYHKVTRLIEEALADL